MAWLVLFDFFAQIVWSSWWWSFSGWSLLMPSPTGDECRHVFCFFLFSHLASFVSSSFRVRFRSGGCCNAFPLYQSHLFFSSCFFLSFFLSFFPCFLVSSCVNVSLTLASSSSSSSSARQIQYQNRRSWRPLPLRWASFPCSSLRAPCAAHVATPHPSRPSQTVSDQTNRPPHAPPPRFQPQAAERKRG